MPHPTPQAMQQTQDSLFGPYPSPPFMVLPPFVPQALTMKCWCLPFSQGQTLATGVWAGKVLLAGPWEHGEHLSLHHLTKGLPADSPAQGNCDAEPCGPLTVAGSLLCRIVWDLRRVSLRGKINWCWLGKHLEDMVSEYLLCTPYLLQN